MEPKILLYSMPKDIHKEIAALCLKLGITCKKVPRGLFNQQIGYHAQLQGFVKTKERYEGEDLAEPMMVFSGLDNALLDRFLDEYKKVGIKPVALKAIATVHNVNWDTFILFDNLCQERNTLDNK